MDGKERRGRRNVGPRGSSPSIRFLHLNPQTNGGKIRGERRASFAFSPSFAPLAHRRSRERLFLEEQTLSHVWRTRKRDQPRNRDSPIETTQVQTISQKGKRYRENIISDSLGKSLFSC